MLRKMETGAAQDTSLLEFIKSKLLGGPGEGGWGCWAVLGHVGWVGTTQQVHTKGVCWESSTVCGPAPAPQGRKDEGKVGTASLCGASIFSPVLH